MIPLSRRFATLWCVLTVALSGAAGTINGQSSSPSSESTERKDLYKDYTPAEFKKLEEAQQEIDSKNFKADLLSAAIFHETNVRRVNHGLSKLDYHPEVDDAAEKHAKQMAEGNYLSHGTPKQPKSTTPYERLKQQGLNPRFSAENIAFNFVLRYESGKPYYTREENGRMVYSYEPGGEPLQRHTYVSFAEAVVEQWMNSPEHRKNILSSEPKYLGVGCAISRDEKGFDKIYCDQDFFDPLPETPLGTVPGATAG